MKINKIIEWVSSNWKLIFDISITIGVILAILNQADPVIMIMIMMWATLLLLKIE